MILVCPELVWQQKIRIAKGISAVEFRVVIAGERRSCHESKNGGFVNMLRSERPEIVFRALAAEDKPVAAFRQFFETAAAESSLLLREELWQVEVLEVRDPVRCCDRRTAAKGPGVRQYGHFAPSQ